MANSKASDPRDHVYAFLWVATDIAVEVDYSLSVAQTFAAAARTMIERNQSLSIFRTLPRQSICTTEGQDKTSTKPSWVPDWTEWAMLRPLLTISEELNLLDFGWLKYETRKDPNQCWDQLVVRGKILDKISFKYELNSRYEAAWLLTTLERICESFRFKELWLWMECLEGDC